MIDTITRMGITKEFEEDNEWRIKKYGVLPYCAECIHSCKVANAPGLTEFYCAKRVKR